jgi:phosphatidate cytidylyltransferase
VFVKHTYNIPFYGSTIDIESIQFHILAMATFASLVAPFGGFFASGLKRTFKIKDFGDLVPGHGGMTDRMDCQFIMGFFAYLYYQSFIAVHSIASVESVLEMAVNSLTPQEQVEVLELLGRYLVGQGIIHQKVGLRWLNLALEG